MQEMVFFYNFVIYSIAIQIQVLAFFLYKFLHLRRRSEYGQDPALYNMLSGVIRDYWRKCQVFYRICSLLANFDFHRDRPV